jgi:hypothetical protein
MALRHFVRLERTVRIGGVRFIPFSPRRFGGHDYTVAPISVLRWITLYSVLKPLQGDKPLLEAIPTLLETLPRPMGLLLLPLFLEDLISPRDLENATTSQILSAWYAFTEVNDLEYILAGYEKAEPDAKPDETGLSFEDHAMFLVEKTNGTRLPHEFLQLPMQYFLAMFECFKRQKNVQEGRPADCDPPSEKELKMLNSYFGGLGVRVVN